MKTKKKEKKKEIKKCNCLLKHGACCNSTIREAKGLLKLLENHIRKKIKLLLRITIQDSKVHL